MSNIPQPLADFVFPPSPTPGQQVTAPNGAVWEWNATSQRWVRLATGGGGGGGQWSTGAGGAIYYNGGSVGIGTSTPTGKLNIVGDDTSRGIVSQYFSNAAHESPIWFGRGRGTPAAPLPIQAGDWIGYLGWGATVASPVGGTRDAASIEIEVPSVTATNIAGNMHFYLSDGVTAQERMTILGSSGMVSVNGGLDVHDGPGGRGTLSVDHYGNDPGTATMYFWKQRIQGGVNQPLQPGDGIMYIGFGGYIPGWNNNHGDMYVRADPGDPTARSGEFMLSLHDGLDNSENGQERLHVYAHRGGLPGTRGTYVGIMSPGSSAYLGFFHDLTNTYMAEIGAYHNGAAWDGLSIDVGAFTECIHVFENTGYVSIGGGIAIAPLTVFGPGAGPSVPHLNWGPVHITASVEDCRLVLDAVKSNAYVAIGFYCNSGNSYLGEIGAMLSGVELYAMNGLGISIDAVTGNVGIKKSAGTAAYSLDVDGDINLTGQIRRAGSVLPVAGGVSVADTAPTTPAEGQLWFDSASVSLCIRYKNAWLQI